MLVRHVCEVCGVEAVLRPDAAFAAGWDHPPHMGAFGVVGPRLCPECPSSETAWWALVVAGRTLDQLTARQRAAVERIAGEPGSVVVDDLPGGG